MRFFVYGTLKPGHERWPILEPHAKSITRAWVSGTLYDLGAYPAMKFNTPEIVPGYVVETGESADLLRSIDVVEGHPFLFVRKNVSVDVGMDTITAHGYEFVNAIHLNREAVIREWHPERDILLP